MHDSRASRSRVAFRSSAKRRRLLHLESLESRSLLAGDVGAGMGADEPAVPVVLEFQDGMWPDAGYAGTRDTRIRAAKPTSNSGGGSALEVDGSPDVATLLRWDLSAVPAGATVSQASLTLNVTGTTAHTYQIYALERDWQERQATWLNAATGAAWQVPGADGGTDRGSIVLGSISVGAVGAATFNLNAAGNAVVQSWIDNPATNFGFVVQNFTSASDAAAFSSREVSTVGLRPKLTVEYWEPGAPVPNNPPLVAAGADQTLFLPNAANLDGTALDDGQPEPPGALTTTWTQIDGPAAAAIADPSAASTSATFSVPGSYVFRLTADDGAAAVFDEVSIEVLDPAVPLVIAFQDGVAPNSGYAGTRDTKIRAEKPTNNSGGSSTLDVDGNPDVATLLRWDVAAIPAGSTVQQASLTLNVTGASVDSYEIYALSRDWQERQATWLNAASGIAWEVPGADGGSDRGATVLGTVSVAALGQATLQLNAAGTAVVQSWIDNPATNFGFVVQDFLSSGDAASVSSREAATAELRPKLTVSYWIPGAPIPNDPPQVDAGADQAVTLPNSASLDGTVSDDGRPVPPGAVTTAWSQVSGPAPVVFADAAAVDTTVSFQLPGSYVLRLTAGDGELSTSDDVTITVDGQTPALVVVQAEQFVARDNSSTHDWLLVPGEAAGVGTLAGATGPYAQSLTDAGLDSGTVNSSPAAPFVEYEVYVAPAGFYALDLFSAGVSTSSDSVWVQVLTGTLANAEGNATGSAGSLAVPTGAAAFSWRNAGQWDLGEGRHTIRVSMRESGAALDALRVERLALPLALADAGGAAVGGESTSVPRATRRARDAAVVVVPGTHSAGDQSAASRRRVILRTGTRALTAAAVQQVLANQEALDDLLGHGGLS